MKVHNLYPIKKTAHNFLIKNNSILSFYTQTNLTSTRPPDHNKSLDPSSLVQHPVGISDCLIRGHSTVHGPVGAEERGREGFRLGRLLPVWWGLDYLSGRDHLSESGVVRSRRRGVSCLELLTVW